MNENCKYCKTAKTCLENAEYNSIYCQIHKRIPKVIDKTYDELLEENRKLKEKYNRALKQLIEYAMPCEIDDFNIKDEYCSKNCGVDEETYLKCWNRFIEQELEKSNKIIGGKSG